jgi:hypothetical protein
MEELQLENKHTSGQWRLFIVSSKVSLKAVLLDNGNKLNTISLVHAVHMTETQENLQVLLQKIIGYNEHRWHTGAGLKLTAVLPELQDG